MMKILFIPLDDRPCTMKFPAHLASVVDFTLITPPEALLGKYLVPGDPRRLLNWVYEKSKEVDAAIISLDMMLYGGLIASRDASLTDDVIAYNSRKFEEWLHKKPIETIYGFNVVMRNMPTYTSQKIVASAPLFLKIVKRLYEISLKSPEKLPQYIEKAEKRIPGDIPRNYFRVRERNHKVNKKALAWRRDKYLSFLVLGLDDVVSKGLNLHEKKILEEIIEKNAIDSVHLYPGTDEMAMMLLARLACLHFGSYPTFSIVYTSEKGKKKIPLYEDRSVEDLVHSYINMLGGVVIAGEGDSDICLFVHLLPGGQTESVWQNLKKYGRRRIFPFIKRIQNLLDAGKLVAVSDIAYANGADCVFSEEIAHLIKIPRLSAYAAWNTAGNTLGTVISHATLRWLSLKFRHLIKEPSLAEKAHNSFLYSRFVDDLLFQSGVRMKVVEICQKSGFSMFNLAESHKKVEHLVDGMLSSRANELFNNAFVGRYELPGVSSCRATFTIEGPVTSQVHLPWPRVFEIDVDCDFTLKYHERLSAVQIS